MLKDIYDPLTEYINVYRDRFKEVARQTFAELAQEAQVDVKANRSTCKEIYANQEALSGVKSRINGWTAWCVILWAGVILGAIYCLMEAEELQMTLLLMIAAILLALIHLFVKVHPRLKELKDEDKRLNGIIGRLQQKAWKQMAPLNRLYDWDVLTRMMSRTVPKLEFDPYFTTQRLADLERTYGWNGSFNDGRSVIYSHSGLINGNPFVICRTRQMEMGSKTYYGHKTIYWTTTEEDSDGKYHTVEHSETLTATVTAPFPEYYETTRLIYGNTAAPDLTFYREQNRLAGKEGSLSYRWNRHSLKKKARNLKHGDFAMMTNEEFEVAFNTSNRNNNQQYALLFTPLAQESMLKLLKDNEAGYGDDFDFEKDKMINTIYPNHMQEIDLDMNPDQYRSFDYDQAEADFYALNARYFRAIYFSLAPLLCVPLYQQLRPQEDIYGRNMPQHSSFWEHEALANFWGQNHFKDPSCVTDCILKTEQQCLHADRMDIMVYAYGYSVEERLSYISEWGGDGRLHDVPVYWDEYLPVTGCGTMHIQEDNNTQEQFATHSERIQHIDDMLQHSHLEVYRKHIASKV